MTKDETVGWHHQLSGHEFEQAPGDSELDAVEKTVSIVMGQANSINFRSKED